ncbi:PQQ-dependent sugar dehydrogenase [soil metagenome]
MRIRNWIKAVITLSLILVATPLVVLGQDATPEATPEASPVAVAPSDTKPRPAQPVIGSFPGPGSIQLVKVADSLNSPRAIAAPDDGTGRIFVGERPGTVRVIDSEGNLLPEPMLDISDRVLANHIDQGLIGLAVHPDFANNGYLYVAYTDFLGNGALKVMQFSITPDDPNKVSPSSDKLIIQISRASTIRNGGTIVFGNDGYLYVASGDGGWAGGTDAFVAQKLDNHWGKILRLGIDVSGEDPVVFTPPDNPFSATWSTYEAHPIWVYGLRNPWAFSFDPETGDLYIPDVGESAWEEINFVPAGTKGQNFGWNLWEGSHCMEEATNRCPDDGVWPIAEYEHAEWGCAVTGIGVYRGSAIPFLNGYYLVGDYCTGYIWGLNRNTIGDWEMQVLLDTSLLFTAGGTGPNGELYVMSCDCIAYDANREVETGGALWLVVGANQIPEGMETAPLDE